jgi:hypothetical protein
MIEQLIYRLQQKIMIQVRLGNLLLKYTASRIAYHLVRLNNVENSIQQILDGVNISSAIYAFLSEKFKLVRTT